MLLRFKIKTSCSLWTTNSFHVFVQVGNMQVMCKVLVKSLCIFNSQKCSLLVPKIWHFQSWLHTYETNSIRYWTEKKISIKKRLKNKKRQSCDLIFKLSTTHGMKMIKLQSSSISRLIKPKKCLPNRKYWFSPSFYW